MSFEELAGLYAPESGGESDVSAPVAGAGRKRRTLHPALQLALGGFGNVIEPLLNPRQPGAAPKTPVPNPQSSANKNPYIIQNLLDMFAGGGHSGVIVDNWGKANPQSPKAQSQPSPQTNPYHDLFDRVNSPNSGGGEFGF